ncbi:hypothetical protein [Photorhabdus heterorhabditis]|uniref:hypothetical protein n=1 Tax=Photorhabdus heterorhabditis TaxID=880156 RepID=UPI001BD48EC4|nr:hypothetical protein [Photorhabdus heterorhabditis]MBS9442458.1 hypothetical protein [Photorhabdus heterorhabditis]
METKEHQLYMKCIANDIINLFENKNQLLEIVKENGDLYNSLFESCTKDFFKRQKDMSEIALTSMCKGEKTFPLAILKHMQDNNMIALKS